MTDFDKSLPIPCHRGLCSAIYKNLVLEKSKQICNNKYMNREHGVDEMEDLRDLNNLENLCATRDITQWGLLGFNRSKEVSKKLCNFIPLPEVEGKWGFTLAEVLITLGIIGVVAALTIANLIQNYREKTTVTQVVKAYSTLSQAFEQAIEDNGTVDGWCTKDELYNDCSIKISNIMKPYLKIEKECLKGNYKCLGGKHKFLYSNNSIYFFNASNQYVLTDGSIVQFKAESGDMYTSRWCGATKNITKQPDRYFGSCGIVYVDVNGLKNPNTFDKDTFTFAIFKDGLALKGLPPDTIVTFNKYCLGKNVNLAYGGHCSGWVVTNKNMDYLHCKDLSWSGKTKCK